MSIHINKKFTIFFRPEIICIEKKANQLPFPVFNDIIKT